MPLSQRQKRRAEKVALYGILVAFSIFMLIPFVWMVSSSLRTEAEMFPYPPNPLSWAFWVPNPIRWENYANAWRALPFTRFLRNTLIITTGRIFGELLSCSMIAYGFARLRARARDLLFIVLLATMMLPGQVTMIPVYILFSKLGWINTFKPFIVPAFFGAPFFIFMLRQFFLNIPMDLDEAARIDGASTFQIYTHIFLPLAKPPLAVIAIFLFMGSWRDFLGPLMYLQETSKYTLALGLMLFRSYGEYATRWDLIMAGSIAMSIPPLLLFFLTQRLIVRGVTLSGIKG